jgi:transcriptional regulator with XRE-family HTH domain
MHDSVNAINAGTLLREARTRARLTQRDLAARAGTTQSVVARIEAGSGSPRMETVERLLRAAGFRPVLTLEAIAPDDGVIGAYRKDIDRTLLRDNLKKSPEQRVRALQALHDLAIEARRAGRARRRA